MFEHSLLAWLLLAVATLIFLPALIIGSVGARRLTLIRDQQSVFTSTTCYVSNITDEILPIDCTCDGCQPSKCYAEHFAVRYPIANGTIVSSVIDVDEVPDLLDIQVSVTCESRTGHRCSCSRRITITRASTIEREWSRCNGQHRVNDLPSPCSLLALPWLE